MTNVEIFFFVIIATILLFNCVFSRTYEDDYSVITHSPEKLIGKWHLVAVLDHQIFPESPECITKTFGKTENHEYLVTSEVKIVDGVATNEEWYINIRGKKMIRVLTFEETYPGHIIYSARQNQFEVFDKSGLLVEENVTESQAYRIYSRNATMNKKIVEFYKNKADEEALTMRYVNVNLCRERNKTQEIIDKGLKNKFLGSWYLIYRICATGTFGEHINLFSYLHVDVLISGNLEIKFHEKSKISTTSFHSQARIFNSKLYELDDTKILRHIYNLTFYDNYTELLVENVEYVECDNIWARRTIDPERSLERYKKISQKKGWILNIIEN